MFDVFYSGTKPNLFAHEQAAWNLDHAQTLSRTRYFWWVNYLTDYTGFDFLWEPVPWQAHQRHAWPSQWQKDSGTYLVPKNGYTDTNYRTEQQLIRLPDDTNWHGVGDIDTSWHPDATDPPYIYQFGTQWQRTGGPVYQVPGATEVKYVNQPRTTKTTQDTYWIVPPGATVDSFDWTWHPDATDPPYIYQFGTQWQRTGGPVYQVPGATEVKYVDQLRIRTDRIATALYEIDHLDGHAGHIPNTTKTVRYFDNYLDTLRRLVKSIPNEHEFVWICSSLCDYADFDFSWHPEQWQATMLHVFASDGEKFGDTFFMHVPTFRYRADQLQLLDWYDLNFVDISVSRRPLPVIYHNYDTHVEAIKTQDWSGPLAIFSTGKTVEQVPPVLLWREKTKSVVPLSAGASCVIVPKTAVPYIKTQVYDYAYIDRTQRHMYPDEPLDIVFIDNGEPSAEYNYLQLPHVTVPNRIHRSSGVTGRVAAYQAAARLSATPWFFAVFAKLQVETKFDWSWQPDRLQEPKHYIFHAHNPVNGLTYGHQAMIAYNRNLVLNNPGIGLDFTLDSAHEVVPILSGRAEYCATAWMAWRTAFRECVKLRGQTDVESKYRLSKWLTESNGMPNGQWSMYGAEDAVDYYDSVGGDFDKLKKSYDWAWLASYAFLKRNLTPDQSHIQPLNL
jgi:hypothetical protein